MEPHRKRRLFKVLGAFVCLAMVLLGTIGILRLVYPMKYSSYVDKYAKLYGVEKSLIYATIKVESDYRPDIESHKGAKGLMQITDETFSWLQTKIEDSDKDDDVYDPETNIKYGVFFLSYLEDRFSSQQEVTAAYHAGIGNVSNWLEDNKYATDGKLDTTPFPATNYYVKKVKNTKTLYEELYSL